MRSRLQIREQRFAYKTQYMHRVGLTNMFARLLLFWSLRAAYLIFKLRSLRKVGEKGGAGGGSCAWADKIDSIEYQA